MIINVAVLEAIDEIGELIHQTDKIKNELFLFSARFTNLKHERRNNLINREEGLIEANRINNGLIEIIDSL